jgi:hypothetical protein
LVSGLVVDLRDVGGITSTASAARFSCPGAVALGPLLGLAARAGAAGADFAVAARRIGFAGTATGATRTPTGRVTGAALAGSAFVAAGAGSKVPTAWTPS